MSMASNLSPEDDPDWREGIKLEWLLSMDLEKFYSKEISF